MSWIKMWREDWKSLDTRDATLKKFGIAMGLVFLLGGGYFVFFKSHGVVGGLTAAVGGGLFGFGVFSPKYLKRPYSLWMGLAFLLRWPVSWILIIMIFLFVMIPLGVLAKMVGKRFLDLDWENRKESYWILKDRKRKIDYERMY